MYHLSRKVNTIISPYNYYQYIQHLIINAHSPILMKSESRLLPRLDQLYTQKKSYEIHRKKVQSINRSNSFSKKYLSQSKLQENQQETKSQRSLLLQDLKCSQPSVCLNSKDILPQTHMQTIQQTKPGISYWLKKMNPHQKRIRQQQIKQNKRIRQKIKNTMSFITRGNQLKNHEQHYTGMKKMLTKFSVDQNTRKTKLKSQFVLTKINELQKSKQKLQQSRLMQFEKKEKSEKKFKTEIVSRTTQRRPQSLMTKRSKVLSQKCSIVSKQSSPNMKDYLLKKGNTSSPNMKSHMLKRLNTNSLARQSTTKIQSKTNELKTAQVSNKYIPNINTNSQRYNRVKTELIDRVSQRRLFNNSKLSDLSAQSSKPKININAYKMIKVNYPPTGPNGMRRMPSLQSTSFEKPKVNSQTVKNQTEMKRYVASRIKTESSDLTKSNNFQKQKSASQFDFQKKRIERFIKSRTSLSSKELKTSLANLNQPSSIVNVSAAQHKLQVQSQKAVIDIERNLQQTKAAILQSHLPSKKLQQIVQKPEHKQSSYFATQIQ